MRNIFDQYRHPENQLTHALFAGLEADRRLLRQFLKWVRVDPPRGARLAVIEQSLPGTETREAEEERSLPDACVFGGEWALVVESKVEAALSTQQLRHHRNMVAARGFRRIAGLALTVDQPRRRLPSGYNHKTWANVYAWLRRHSARSHWAARIAEYMEVAEARDIEATYMTRGTLTRFSGVHFNAENPYSYQEGKRVLGLLRRELASNRELRRKIDMDPLSGGRGAITGRDRSSVWDFLGLRRAADANNFTEYPHLTIGVHHDQLNAFVTVPHGVRAQFRRTLLGGTFDDFEELIRHVTKGIHGRLGGYRGASPSIVVVQRHYKSQRSVGVEDCRLQFDPRTAFASLAQSSRPRIRFQPQWLRATYDALKSKRGANVQFQIGAIFPYAACAKTKSPDIAYAVAGTWLATKPILDRCK